MERASGYHACDQSHKRSFRTVALSGGQWSSSVVTSLSWHSAIVVLSRSLMPASNLRGRLTWFQKSHGQLCDWNKEQLGDFSVFSAVIGVFDDLMSASVRMHAGLLLPRGLLSQQESSLLTVDGLRQRRRDVVRDNRSKEGRVTGLRRLSGPDGILLFRILS